MRDPASERFRRIPELFAEIVDIFNEAMQADVLVNEANSGAQAGESSRLLRTEEHARDLEGFTRARPSLMKETVLIDFDGRQIWPPRSSVGAAYAAMMSPVEHRQYEGEASGNWWQRGQQVNVRQGQEMQRIEKEKNEFYSGQR